MELQALLSISVLAVVLVSVTSRAQDPLATGRFRTLLEDDWAYWMAQYPETAPALGYRGHDARRTDYSPAAVAARASHLRDTLTRLDSIDRHGLSADDTVNFDLYRDMIATAIEGLAFGKDPMPLRGVVVRNLRMPLNQMDAVQQDIPRTLSLMPAATVGDYENIIARLRPARLEARRSGDVEGSVRPSRE